jgi:hypothetical protein
MCSCTSVLCNTELTNDEIEYLVKYISKQVLNVYNKIQDRNDLKVAFEDWVFLFVFVVLMCLVF